MKLEMMFLGGLQLSQDGTSLVDFSSEKGKALLCYLAVTGQPHSRASLAGLLWPESLEANARASLRKVLTEIRTKAPPCLNSTRQTVAIDPDASTWVDVIQFERSVTVAADIDGLQEAVALYQGDFLERFLLPDAPAFDRWALRQRARLRQMAVEALHTLATHFAERQDYDTAVSYARQLLDIEPWHEETHRELMRLLALSGQRSAALAQYELCRRLLADELGIEPAAATVQLYEQIKGEEWSEEAESPPLPHSSAPPHNLPPQMTPFVGRESELAQLQQLLAAPDIHLITILGPGGMGKTRLALALAASQLHGQQQPYPFRHGVYFASLARLETADLLVSAIAEAINFRFAESDDLQGQLLRYLAAKAMLLVFDNFEHLLAGTGLVDAILHAAPQVKIVITSRARLNRQVEQLFLIGGMTYPQVNGGTNGDSPLELNHYSAVQLFVQCARRVRPDFGLTAANQPHILKICQLLQGMPLGLALAASWLESLSPRAISREVQQDIDFLVTDMGDVPRRQRSLRAAFNHSWRLLSTREREIFCQMSIFRGGSTRAAAQAVTGATLRDLQALVNKSLLTLTADRRYDVHELLRQYGAEKLAENGERETAVRQQHSHFYCTALQQWETDLKSSRQQTAVAAMEADYQNILAAWNEALTQGYLAQLVNAVNGLGEYYDATGRWVEGVSIMQMGAEKVQAVYGDTPAVATTAQLLVWLWAWRVNLSGTVSGLYTQWEEQSLLLHFLQPGWNLLAQPVLAELDIRAEKAFVQLLFGRILPGLEIEKRKEHLAASLHLYQLLHDNFHVAENLLEQSYYLFLVEDMPEQAYLLLQESLTLFRQIGEPRRIVVTLCRLGEVARSLLLFDEAVRFFDEAYAIAQGVTYYLGMIEARIFVASLVWQRGQFDLALTYLEEALVWAKQTNSPPMIGVCLGRIALTQLYCGQVSQALSLLQESMELNPNNWLSVMGPFIQLHAGHYETAESLLRIATRLKALKFLAWVRLVQGDYAEALSVAYKGYAEVPMGNYEHRAWTQVPLAFALYCVDRVAEAKQELYQCLQTCVKIRAFLPLMQLIPIIPVVLADGTDDKLKERSIELYALAEGLSFVRNSQLFADLAGKPMAAVADTLPPSVVESAQARGQELDWWETAESLLSELQALGWHEMRPAQP